LTKEDASLSLFDLGRPDADLRLHQQSKENGTLELRNTRSSLAFGDSYQRTPIYIFDPTTQGRRDFASA